VRRLRRGVFVGKGAREDAGNALNIVVMSWRDDKTAQVQAHFKGFEILSRGVGEKDGVPDLFIRGKEAYKANLNPENPLGTISSIEHVLRVLDRKAEDEQQEIERQEKALADYRAQLGRPFEHELRLKDLLAKQAQLNACLDLDKREAQIVDEPREPEDEAVSIAARRAPSSGPAVARAARPSGYRCFTLAYESSVWYKGRRSIR
jgi:hypothetical protein